MQRPNEAATALLATVVFAAQCLLVVRGIRIGKQWTEMMAPGLGAVAMVGVLVSVLLAARSATDRDADS